MTFIGGPHHSNQDGIHHVYIHVGSLCGIAVQGRVSIHYAVQLLLLVLL